MRVPCRETTELRPLLGRAFHLWGVAGTGCPLSIVSTEAQLGDELSPAFKLGHSSIKGKKALMLRMSYRSYLCLLKKRAVSYEGSEFYSSWSVMTSKVIHLFIHSPMPRTFRECSL